MRIDLVSASSLPSAEALQATDRKNSIAQMLRATQFSAGDQEKIEAIMVFNEGLPNSNGTISVHTGKKEYAECFRPVQAMDLSPVRKPVIDTLIGRTEDNQYILVNMTVTRRHEKERFTTLLTDSEWNIVSSRQMDQERQDERNQYRPLIPPVLRTGRNSTEIWLSRWNSGI